jgi:hypothetical protein
MELASDLKNEKLRGATKAMSKQSQPKEDSYGTVDDDFFSTLEAELSLDLNKESSASNPDMDTDGFVSSSDGTDTFFDETFTDDSQLDTKPSMAARSKPRKTSKVKELSLEHNNDTDLSALEKRTVPELKELLRERGLKLSGKKAELIERLTAGS